MHDMLKCFPSRYINKYCQLFRDGILVKSSLVNLPALDLVRENKVKVLQKDFSQLVYAKCAYTYTRVAEENSCSFIHVATDVTTKKRDTHEMSSYE